MGACGFRHARFYEQEFPWRGGARCDLDKGVGVVGLEEADGGEDASGSGAAAVDAAGVDAGGPGVAAGGDGGAGVGGPSGAAGNAGAEPVAAGGPGGGAGGEQAPALRRSKRPWMPSAGCLDQYAAVAQLDDSPTLDQALSGPNAQQWWEAMQDEIATCERMCVWKRTTSHAAAGKAGSGLQVGANHHEEEERSWRN